MPRSADGKGRRATLTKNFIRRRKRFDSMLAAARINPAKAQPLASSPAGAARAQGASEAQQLMLAQTTPTRQGRNNLAAEFFHGMRTMNDNLARSISAQEAGNAQVQQMAETVAELARTVAETRRQLDDPDNTPPPS